MTWRAEESAVRAALYAEDTTPAPDALQVLLFNEAQGYELPGADDRKLAIQTAHRDELWLSRIPA